MMLFPNQHARASMLQKIFYLIVRWLSMIKEHAYRLTLPKSQRLSGDYQNLIHVDTLHTEMTSRHMQHDQRVNDMLRLVGERHLQQILKQVRAEGFCVESLVIFRDGHLKPSETIAAIESWASKVGLKVGFNHEHQLCFFERA